LVSTNLDTSEVSVPNLGVLSGSGNFDFGLTNSAGGEVETSRGERLRFGQGTNMGDINNFGGQVRFEQSLSHQATGFVGGRDLFIDYQGGDGNDVALFTTGFPGDFDLMKMSMAVTFWRGNAASAQISTPGTSTIGKTTMALPPVQSPPRRVCLSLRPWRSVWASVSWGLSVGNGCRRIHGPYLLAFSS